MEYDFSRPTERRGTDSYKWDSAPEADIIPLWVADMDFETFPSITEALQRRVAHGIFGYTRVPEAYYEAVCRWFGKHHGWHINREDIIYTSGVVPAVSAVIKALTLPGDQVIVQGPVYNCFFSSIRNNGCETVSNSLIYNKEELRYEIDFDDLERKLAHERARLMLICNPHNPGGRVWTRDELTRVAELCHKYGVRVVSDEIHCELTLYDNEYVPFGSLPDELSHGSITCCSPSKAFNTAGLQIANIVLPRRRGAQPHRPRHKHQRGVRREPVRSNRPAGCLQRRGLRMAHTAARIHFKQLRLAARTLRSRTAQVQGDAHGGHVSGVDRLLGTAYLVGRNRRDAHAREQSMGECGQHVRH